VTTAPGTDPIAEDTTAATATVRIARRDRRSLIVLVAGVVFLAAAIGKPWSWGTPPDDPGSPRLDGVATALAPAADGSGPPALDATGMAKDRIRAHCQDPLGWRVYTRERWSGTPVRVWRRLEPAMSATGPVDPTIPTVEVGPEVFALGYCSPWSSDEAPPAGAIVSAWRIEPGATGPAPFAAIQPLVQVAPAQPTVLGSLFDPAGVPGQWPVGRFVFAVRAGDWARWWTVVVMPEHVAAR
jgi:hypothetical protein